MNLAMKVAEFVFKSYYGVMDKFFYAFLFCTLSFGRAFSVFHVNTFYFPAYVTEIFLFLNIPVLLYKYKENSLKMPKAFLTALLIFFSLACLYLLAGFYSRPMLALRDVTIPGYILFLFIAIIYLNSLKKIKVFIFIFFLANLVNISLGLCLLFDLFPQGMIGQFISKTKFFNVGLYYGMSIALIALFYELIKPKMYRLCALVLLSFNAGLLFLSSQSSLWVATLSLIVFLVFVLKKKFIKLLRSFVLMFLLLGLIIYCVSPEKAGSFYKRNIYRELKSIGLFSSYALQHKLVAKVSNVENAVEQINEYQRQMALLKAAVKADVDLKTPLPQVEALPSRGEESKAAVKANVDLNSLSLQYASLDESSRIENNLDNINWRLSIWKQTLRFGLGSPIIGRGFGAYPVYKIYASRQYPNGIYEDSRIVPVHNHIITVFLKMGVIGLGFFLFLNIYVFIYALAYLKKCNLKFMNNLLIALLGSLVFWHALAFFFDIIDSPPTSIWLWLLIGLIFATIEADKKLLNIKE